ncbi:MAG: hypothetical protein HY870_05455 [Chloroflexi bacterium]|nr:hypothetical protein [Chloroflexota bacterium]
MMAAGQQQAALQATAIVQQTRTALEISAQQTRDAVSVQATATAQALQVKATQAALEQTRVAALGKGAQPQAAQPAAVVPDMAAIIEETVKRLMQAQADQAAQAQPAESKPRKPRKARGAE